jgi:hypothetical protein
MPFLTTLQFPGTETAVERDIREVGQILSSTARDLRSIGTATSSVIRDMKLGGSTSPIAYVGQLGQAGTSSSGTSLQVTTPFVTSGSHLILIVTHISGANVSGATDSKGNTYTIDQPSTFSGTLGMSIVSAPILTSLQAGDTVTVN